VAPMDGDDAGAGRRQRPSDELASRVIRRQDVDQCAGHTLLALPRDSATIETVQPKRKKFERERKCGEASWFRRWKKGGWNGPLGGNQGTGRVDGDGGPGHSRARFCGPRSALQLEKLAMTVATPSSIAGP
jgi:hypothetical protein